MTTEEPEFEMQRLRAEQNKTRRDEVFGGLSLAERAAYEGKSERILSLEAQIQRMTLSGKKKS